MTVTAAHVNNACACPWKFTKLFESGSVKIHLGVEADFRPARKAHPALLVSGLRALVERLREARVEVVEEPLDDHFRVYVTDPFGNRLELMEPVR